MFFIHVTSNFNSFIHRLIVSVCPAFWPLRRLHGQNDVRHCAKCFAAVTADEALRARGGLETGADVILQWTFCTIASCFHLGTLDPRLHYDMKWKWSFHLETTIASLLFFLLFLKRTFFYDNSHRKCFLTFKTGFSSWNCSCLLYSSECSNSLWGMEAATRLAVSSGRVLVKNKEMLYGCKWMDGWMKK